MTTTLTISAPLAMAAVPGLIALGGVVVGIALNGWLTTGIEVARLNAANDDKTARWLWRNGYRKTPHAGPDITPEVAAPTSDDHVTGEVLAVDGVDTEADAPHEDTDRAGMWRVFAALVWELADRAHDWVADKLAWLAYLLKSQSARDAEFTETYHRALEAARDEQPPTNPSYKSHRCPHGTTAERDPGYRSRHTAAGYETGIFPAINPAIPAQRTDGDH